MQNRNTCSCFNQCAANAGKSWSTVQRGWSRDTLQLNRLSRGSLVNQTQHNWQALLTFRLPETKENSVLTEPGITSHPTQKKKLIKAWNRERRAGERKRKERHASEEMGTRERNRRCEAEKMKQETGKEWKCKKKKRKGKHRTERGMTHGINSSACKTKISNMLRKICAILEMQSAVKKCNPH